tara:strand:+ start:837 stop:950 length:114 start_codon:yes stop_codon:yes gene_type:complete
MMSKKIGKSKIKKIKTHKRQKNKKTIKKKETFFFYLK